MKQIVIVEKKDMGDQGRIVLDGPAWHALSQLAGRHGFLLNEQASLGRIDSGLFAEALRNGMKAYEQGRAAQDRFNTHQGVPSISSETVDKMLTLLDTGYGITITKRARS